MSSSRNRGYSDAPRRDSYDDYQRRASYQGNGYGDGHGDYDRDGYRPRDYDDKVGESSSETFRSLICIESGDASC